MRLSRGKFNNYFFYNIVFSIFLLFFSNRLAAQQSQDFIKVCQDTNANYREFGNNCHDRCLPQFDQSQACFKAVTFGCDCGENNCLFEGKCISKKEFSAIFKEIIAQRDQDIIEYKKELVKKMNDDPDYGNYIRNMYKKSSAQQSEEPSIAQTGSKNFIANAQRFVDQEKQTEQAKNNKGKSSQNNNTNVSKAIKFIAEKDTNKPPVNNQIPQFYIDKQVREQADAELKIPASEIEAVLPIVPIVTP